MCDWLNLITIKIYSAKLATDFYVQQRYTLDDTAPLENGHNSITMKAGEDVSTYLNSMMFLQFLISVILGLIRQFLKL